MSAADTPVEHLHVRRHNLSLVLRLLANQGPRSRAGIAGVTGLTRATVSSLTAELIELGLVRELGIDADHRRGRPATLLELDGAHVVTIGVELNVGYISILARDLGAREVFQRHVVVDVDENRHPGELITILAKEISEAISAVQDDGRRASGITVAVPGVVDAERGRVRIAPNLGWRSVPLLAELQHLIGHDIAVALDNEANLGALAEYRAGALAGTPNLIYILAERGVGGGLVVDGKLLRGASGAAGEMGHTTIQPQDGMPCGCGARGCWETLIGLPALLRRTLPDTADALLSQHQLDLPEQVAAVVQAVEAGDEVARRGLDEFAHWVGLGIANLIDLFDPDAVILAGTLHDLGELIMPTVRASAAANSLPDSLQHCRVEISSLGFSAAALGGAIHAAERLFVDPPLVARS